MSASRLRARPWVLSRLIFQIGALFLLLSTGQWMVTRFHLPVPGNVMGMLLLFVLLSAGVVREPWIQEAAGLLTKHLAFFFIPIAVGLMQWGPLFRREGHWLLLALAGSTLASLLAAGGVVRLLAARPLKEEGNQWETSRSLAPPSSSPSASTRSVGAPS